MKYLVRVGRSSAGMGLFAGAPIKKGARVMEYVGEIISAEEADKRGGKYLFEIDSKRTIDGSARSNIARYINHSCKPNCEAQNIRSHIWIYAKKDIKPGDELTYDYGKEYFDEYIKPVGCKCASCAAGVLSKYLAK